MKSIIVNTESNNIFSSSAMDSTFPRPYNAVNIRVLFNRTRSKETRFE